MDGVIDEMAQKVLDWHVQTISRHDLRRWAQHLREVVQPQLAELAQLKAAASKPPAKGKD